MHIGIGHIATATMHVLRRYNIMYRYYFQTAAYHKL